MKGHLLSYRRTEPSYVTPNQRRPKSFPCDGCIASDCLSMSIVRISSVKPCYCKTIERLKQIRVAKWFEQALHRTVLQHLLPEILVSASIMKTIGISCRRSVSSRCRSGPVIPGMAMSRIRHRVWETQSDARNSSADENAWAAKPNIERAQSARESR